MKTLYKTSLYLIMSVAAVSCGESTEPAADAAHQHDHAEMGDFRTGVPKSDTIYRAIECTGMVDVPPQSRATVSAPLGGFLREVRFYPGEQVKKGDILARIAHPDYVDLQRTYLDAKSRSEFLKLDYDRKMQLYREDAINSRTLEEVKAEYDVQRTTMNAAAASLRQMGIQPEGLTPDNIQSELILRSPINGHITHIDANLGQHVTPEQPLYEIVDDTHMHIELNVFPRDIQWIQKGQEIVFYLPGDSEPHMGEVKQIGRQVEATSGAFIIHAHAEEEVEGLRPGQFVDGEIVINPHRGFVLPQSAVVSEGDSRFIFVQDGDEFVKTKVRTGIEMDDYIEILDSISKPVVLENAHLLMDAGEGHSH